MQTPRFRFAVRSGTVLLAALLAPCAALAADMPDYVAPGVQEFGSNWYLRGDIGYTWQSAKASGGAWLYDYSEPPELPDVQDPSYFAPFGGAAFDDTWVIGGGFGVHASEWLRFDFTADFRMQADGTASGLFSTYNPANEFPWSEPGNYSTVSTNLTSTLLLANAYLDLGTWSGFTPYVGAGVGMGYLRLGNAEIANVGTASFDSQWSFAWALMAGTSFAITPNLSIDVGYRYSSIAGTSFGSEVYAVDGSGYMGPINVKVDDINTQEVRIGARYLID